MKAVNFHRASSSQLLDRREPVHVFTQLVGDREDHVDDRLLAGGVLERTCVHGVVTRIAVELLHDLARPPLASFETLGTILAAVENDSPNVTVIPSELFSAEIPGRVLAGELDIGLALHPEPMTGIASEVLRGEPLAAQLSKRHRLARADSIPLADLQHETLLLFPRELAPAYYDRIMESCERAGFQPQVRAFPKPPVNAMLARLLGAREVGLSPASFAFHSAQAEPGIVARKIVDPQILAEWSILWAARAESAAIMRFLDSARRCAADNDWLPTLHGAASAEPGSLAATSP
jgi:hypothetical protein